MLVVLRRALCSLARAERLVAVGAESISPSLSASLSPSTEDLSDVGRHVAPVFNFAYFVDRSPGLQELVKLGVNLHAIEKNPRHAQSLFNLDFERDIKKHLLFLSDYVEADSLGKFITKNPLILKEDLDNLQTRINYLESKKFDRDAIRRIVTLQPFWLMFNTVRIDKRLGYFQREYRLTGNEVRSLAAKQPKLITYSMNHITVNYFAIKNEMGFQDCQIKKLLLDKPKLWMINQQSLIQRFNYVHIKMNISHEDICKMPEVLMCRVFRIKQRNEFLKKIGRDQYYSTKPNYVSLVKLVEGTDAEFCFNVAKCTVSEYNLYLKSL